MNGRAGCFGRAPVNQDFSAPAPGGRSFVLLCREAEIPGRLPGMAGNHCNYCVSCVLLMAGLWKGQEGIKMGSIVEAAIYEFVSKFFLIFVVVPAGIIFLGYIIYIIVEVINEIRKK